MTTHLPTTLNLPSLERHRRASDALSVDLSRPNVNDGDCPLTTAANNYFKRLAFVGSCRHACPEVQCFDLAAQTEMAKELVCEALQHMAAEFGVDASTMRGVVRTALEERGFRGRPSVERLCAIRDEVTGITVV